MITDKDAAEVIDYIRQSLREADEFTQAQQAGWFRQALDQVAWRLQLHLEVSQ